MFLVALDMRVFWVGFEVWVKEGGLFAEKTHPSTLGGGFLGFWAAAPKS
jgi:hypothetical protein